MKRWMCVLLALALMLAQTAILAKSEREDQPQGAGFWSNIGGHLDQAFEKAGKAVNKALDKAGIDTEDAWDGAKRVLGKAWDWTSERAQSFGKAAGAYLSEAFGDVKSWAAEKSDEALDWLYDILHRQKQGTRA